MSSRQPGRGRDPGRDLGGDPGPAVAPEGSTRELARFAVSLDVASLPPVVLHQARRLLLDTVGCIVGGHATRTGRLAVAWATDGLPAAPGSSGALAGAAILGTTHRARSPLAAYANGRLAAVLDADEMWPSTRQAGHLAAASIAAALAVTDARDGTAGDLLASIVAGYEVAGRVSDSLLPQDGAGSAVLRAGWGPGSPIGAAAAAARGLALDAESAAHALGIAGGHADPPPLQWTAVRPAPMAKSADAGWHALTGVTAAEMARIGLTGFDTLLDGERGLWRAMGYAGCDPDALTGSLGTRWRILDAALKRWPCQYWMHPALTALEGALTEAGAAGIAPSMITRILLATNGKSFSAKFHDPDPPGEIDRAFSFPHAAAMIVCGIVPGPAWLDDVTARDPAIVRLRPLVEVRLHEDAERIDGWARDLGYRDLPARATVAAGDRSWTCEVRHGRGAPWSSATALDDEALLGKARELGHAALAGDRQGVDRYERALETILAIDVDRPVRELTSLLVGLVPPSPSRSGPPSGSVPSEET